MLESKTLFRMILPALMHAAEIWRCNRLTAATVMARACLAHWFLLHAPLLFELFSVKSCLLISCTQDRNTSIWYTIVWLWVRGQSFWLLHKMDSRHGRQQFVYSGLFFWTWSQWLFWVCLYFVYCCFLCYFARHDVFVDNLSFILPSDCLQMIQIILWIIVHGDKWNWN